MKKRYYYKIDKKTKRQNGGFNVNASVYAIRNGEVKKLGTTKWNTASSKGEYSEVYDFLKSKKLVTAKEYKENNGYYMYSKSKIIIDSL